MYIWLSGGSGMAIQIANPEVVEKIERLARLTGLNKTAAVDRAVENMLRESAAATDAYRMEALLAQLDRIPDRADASDPLPWDEHGLPR